MSEPTTVFGTEVTAGDILHDFGDAVVLGVDIDHEVGIAHVRYPNGDAGSVYWGKDAILSVTHAASEGLEA